MNDKDLILREVKPSLVWRNTKVDVCNRCEGEGIINAFIMAKNEWDFEQCSICAGSGMVEKRLVVNIYPFNKRLNEIK